MDIDFGHELGRNIVLLSGVTISSIWQTGEHGGCYWRHMYPSDEEISAMNADGFHAYMKGQAEGYKGYDCFWIHEPSMAIIAYLSDGTRLYSVQNGHLWISSKDEICRVTIEQIEERFGRMPKEFFTEPRWYAINDGVGRMVELGFDPRVKFPEMFTLEGDRLDEAELHFCLCTKTSEYFIWPPYHSRLLYQQGHYVFHLKNGDYYLLEYGEWLEKFTLEEIEILLGTLPDEFKSEIQTGDIVRDVWD